MNTSGNNHPSSMTQTKDWYSKHRKWLSVASVLILVVFTIAAVYTLRNGSSLTQEEVSPFDTLRGTLYLTLGSESSENESGLYVDVYAYDIETGVLDRAIKDDYIKMTASVSPDGDFLAYAAARYDQTSQLFFPQSTPFTLTTYNFSSGETIEITLPSLQRDYFYPRFYSWSPSMDRVAYSGALNLQEFFMWDSWGVYVADLEGNERRVGSGVQPFWSPDGEQILAFMENGAHVYTVNTGEDSLVTIDLLDTPIPYVVKFGMSDDKTLLAWSEPAKNRVAIAEIKSWGPFRVKVVDQVFIPGYDAAYFPVFSPDNRYIAYEQIDYDPQTKIFSNSRLVVYDREAKATKAIADLSDYLSSVIFVDDWRY